MELLGMLDPELVQEWLKLLGPYAMPVVTAGGGAWGGVVWVKRNVLDPIAETRERLAVCERKWARMEHHINELSTYFPEAGPRVAAWLRALVEDE